MRASRTSGQQKGERWTAGGLQSALGNYYPFSDGRNILEIAQLGVALQTAAKYNVAAPADRIPGQDVILPPPGSCGTLEAQVCGEEPGVTCVDWFMGFR